MSDQQYVIFNGQAVPVGTGLTAFGQTSVAVVNGLNSNVMFGGLTSTRLTGPTGAFSIGGLVGSSAPVSGQTLTIENTTAQPMTIVHEDLSSTAINRIAVANGTNFSYLSGYSKATFVYDGATSRWAFASDGIEYRRVYDVRDYGAKCDGTTDDSAAINAAIAAAAASGGNGTVFIPKLCAVTSTITVGGSSDPVYGVSIRGPSHAVSNGGSVTAGLKWTGGSGATMMVIRDAYGGTIENLGFDSNQLAEYGLQFNAVSGDALPIEMWHVNRCAFANATAYNVLIGTPDGNTSNGDTSCVQFNSCIFPMTYTGTTTGHVRHRSANSLGNSFINCEFYGTQETVPAVGGHFQPLYAMNISGGTVNTYSCISQGLDTCDFLLSTPVDADVPGGLCVYGHVSQSANFVRVDPRGSSAPLYPVVLSGVNHSDITGTGTFSLKWNRSGYTMCVVEGGFYDRGINIVEPASDVVLNGPWWTAARGGSTVSGHPESCQGHWYVDSNVYSNILATDKLAVNAPAINFNSAQVDPSFSITAPASDLATTGLHIIGQSPYALATVNKAPGDVYIGPTAPIAGGSLGTLHLTNGSVDALQIVQNPAQTVTSLQTVGGVTILEQLAPTLFMESTSTTITLEAATFISFIAAGTSAMSVQTSEVNIAVPLVLTGQTTSASASTGTITLPVTAAGYLDISINGSPFKIPYYNP